MPYRPPTFNGIFSDQLVIKANGAVEFDGKHVGWINVLDVTPMRQYRAGRSAPEEYAIKFDMIVLPEKYEPDAVYTLASGKKVGYMTPEGFVPCD